MSDSNSVALERKAIRGAAAYFGDRRSAKTRAFGAWYAAEHRLLTMRSFLSSIIATSIFNPLMYIFALGIGIGSYVDASGGELFGVSYLVFVGPALICSAAINVIFEETSFPVMGGFRWTKEFYAMHASPLEPHQISSGVLLAALIRGVFTVFVFWFFLSVFGVMPSSRSWLLLIIATVTGMAIGSVIAAIAASLKEDDGWFALINRMIIAPMFLFSGTFYPLEQMPLYVRWIGWISPLWHGTNLGRWAAFEMEVPTPLLFVHVIYLLTLMIGGWFWASHSFAGRLEE
jgi:lipooligosaccharide transport system permease protein